MLTLINILLIAIPFNLICKTYKIFNTILLIILCLNLTYHGHRLRIFKEYITVINITNNF